MSQNAQPLLIPGAQNLSAEFYSKLDKMLAACDAKSAEELKTTYKAVVESFDVVLGAVGMPAVAIADPKLVATP